MGEVPAFEPTHWLCFGNILWPVVIREGWVFTRTEWRRLFEEGLHEHDLTWSLTSWGWLYEGRIVGWVWVQSSPGYPMKGVVSWC